jgi:diguanylate cyclase (GGDEF)-like protein/PAS domain S-box-containing protein
MNRTEELLNSSSAEVDERFAILDHSPIGQFILREDYVVLFWNRCLEGWTGLDRRQVVGTSITEHYPHLAAAKYTSRIDSIFHGGPPTIFSSQLHRFFIPVALPGGKHRFQSSVVTAVPSGNRGIWHAMFSIQDVTHLTEAIDNHRRALRQAMVEMERRKQVETELMLQAEELQRLNLLLKERSVRDGLTGLFNHRHFHEVLEKSFHFALRYGEDLSCLVLDLDHFKRVNDRYGHMAGDSVLRQFAEHLQNRIRCADVAARYGGEEFGLLLPKTDLQGALALAEQIRSSLEDSLFFYGEQEIAITASIGLASLSTGEFRTPQDLILAADRALYRAKTEGRNRIFHHDPSQAEDPLACRI